MATNGFDDTVRDPEHPQVMKAQQENFTKSDEERLTQAADVSSKARDLTNRVLDFLSNASNEALGACMISLAATTWLVLGRVGLVIIGIVGGVVLHATWEGNSQGNADAEASTNEVRKRREKGLDIVARVLDWRERTKEEKELDRTEPELQKALDFVGFQPETGAALAGLTDAVIRDYVKWWYSPVLPLESSFPFACRQILTGFLLSVSFHLSRKRPADTFLDFLTNSSSIIIVFLSELSSALKPPGASSDASIAVRTYLEANPNSSLSNVLDVEQQNKKLIAIAEDILHTFLEPKAYACEPIRVFLREILAGVILEMTVTSCSRPEFINEWIIYSLEEGNTELLDAIDAGVGGATANGNVKHQSQPSDIAAPEGYDGASNPSTRGSQAKTEHKRTISRAEDAMGEALEEAKRLSERIATEEARKGQSLVNSASSEVSSAAQITPTSSRDNLSAIVNGSSLPAATPTSSRDDLSVAINRSSPAPATENGDRAVPKSKISEAGSSFTTFDQIISSQQSTTQASQSQPYAVPPLTLFNASVSIFDDSQPGEKGTIRSKPTAEYLLQIEPATSQHPGWMIARKYPDFETLHEVLRRISVISGVAAFAERHPTLPAWKSKTKAILRSELEHYLRDACSFQRLAESEGMKRFLEKDQGLASSSPNGNKSGFGFPSPAAFETMGKGMRDVLASTPKGAASGGKAILGGVTGVLGGVGSIGQKKQNPRSTAPSKPAIVSAPNRSRVDSNISPRPSFVVARDSNESPRQSVNMPRENIKPPLPRRRSQAQHDQQNQNSLKTNGNIPEKQKPSVNTLEDSTSVPQSQDAEQELHLPPPPSEIPDDYNVAQTSPRNSLSNDDSSTLRTPTSTAPTTLPSPSRTRTSSLLPTEAEPAPPPLPTKRNSPTPLTAQETSVAVELFFATINELYTLSSAWTLRLTLLNAAKSFLLRSGNPNLEAIRVLLQSTMIDANTSDTGIATHLTKLRENSLPTEDELKAWPPPPSDEAKERMRVKARKLLVEKGTPQALSSVMGAAASGEALGRVLDCLQIPEVARGLVFALILQGVRAVTQ